MKKYSFGKFFCSLTIADYTIRRQQLESVSLRRQSAIQVEWSHIKYVFTRIYVTHCMYSSRRKLQELQEGLEVRVCLDYNGIES